MKQNTIDFLHNIVENTSVWIIGLCIAFFVGTVVYSFFDPAARIIVLFILGMLSVLFIPPFIYTLWKDRNKND